MQDTVLKITLPFPPTVNTYWRTIRVKGRQRTILSEKARDYKTQVAYEILRQGLNFSFKPGELLRVGLKLYPPDKRQRDVDNYTKGVFDALTACHFWDDDSQVKKLQIEMCYVVKPAIAEIEIQLL